MTLQRGTLLWNVQAKVSEVMFNDDALPLHLPRILQPLIDTLTLTKLVESKGKQIVFGVCVGSLFKRGAALRLAPLAIGEVRSIRQLV